MSRTPKGIPTPNPIARDLSDVVVRVVEEVDRGVVGEAAMVVVLVVGEAAMFTGRHILTAVLHT
jgi:hypothetical protein